MDPIKHVLLAVVPVACYTVVRRRRIPSGAVVLTAVWAGLFADLVDKPLAWQLGLIPSGRMVAHSLVLSVPLIVGVLLSTVRINHLQYGLVFAWGHLSHIAVDFSSVLSRGTESYWFPNLFWPLLPANPDRTVGYADNLPVFDLTLLIELCLLAAILSYVIVDIGSDFHTRRQSG